MTKLNYFMVLVSFILIIKENRPQNISLPSKLATVVKCTYFRWPYNSCRAATCFEKSRHAVLDVVAKHCRDRFAYFKYHVFFETLVIIMVI